MGESRDNILPVKVNGNLHLLVSFSSLVAIIVAAWCMSAKWTRMEGVIIQMERHMEKDWELRDQMSWASRLQIAAPNITIPDPRDVRRME